MWWTAFFKVGEYQDTKAGVIEQKEALKTQGAARQAAAEFAAAEQERLAVQDEAEAQLAAQRELQIAAQLQSKALAIAGASGASASDPTMTTIIGKFAEEGMMNAQMRLYSGRSSARDRRYAAEIARWEGRMAARGINAEIAATNRVLTSSRNAAIAGTASSWIQQYGGRRDSMDTSSTNEDIDYGADSSENGSGLGGYSD